MNSMRAFLVLVTVTLLAACGSTDTITVTPDGPVATSLSVTSGFAFGGTANTLTGENFTQFTEVTMGGKPVIDQVIVNDTTITFVVPSNPSGLVDLTVANDFGSDTLTDAWNGTPTQLWGADGKAGTAGYLWGIDPATGNANMIGPIGFGITGMVYFTDGFLYGTESSNGSTSRLIRIDPVTGAGTAIGLLETAGMDAHPSIAGLAIEGGALIGWSENGDQPVRIDHTTGEVTVIGGGSGSSGSGMATNAGGTVFCAINGPTGTLDTVDPATGVVTAGVSLSGASGNVFGVNAMTFLSGTLYALANEQSGSPAGELELYSVDVGTGALTLIKAYDPGFFDGRAMDALAGRQP